jgi:hypothetical protein
MKDPIIEEIRKVRDDIANMEATKLLGLGLILR